MIHDDEYPDDRLPNWVRYGGLSALWIFTLIGVYRLYEGFFG